MHVVWVVVCGLVDASPLKLSKSLQLSKTFYVGEYRQDGVTPYFHHPLSVAKLVNKYYTKNHNIVHAALLHESLNYVSCSYLIEHTSLDICMLVNKFQCPVEYLDDKDVAVLKLLHCLEELTFLSNVDPQICLDMAKRTQEVYVPIAYLLSMEDVQDKLSDLSFKILEPDYHKYLDSISNKKLFVSFISYLEDCITRILSHLNIYSFELQSRVKRPYSIRNKMYHYGFESVNQVKDLIAVRIIIDSNDDTCYKVLEKIHYSWPFLDNCYKDFIKQPKMNGYRSLHTVIIVWNYEVEIQIRTQEMHIVAEYGTASHSNYKLEFLNI